MSSNDTRVLTAHVPTELAEKIDMLAARLDRSKGWIIKQALFAWVDLEEERDRLTQEALLDVEQGAVLEHSRITSWIENLGKE